MMDNYKAENGTEFHFSEDLSKINIQSRKKEIVLDGSDMIEFIQWFMVQLIVQSCQKEKRDDQVDNSVAETN
ncbi:MAG: hypothetical protein HN757_02560 [Calditrichaeota bacterium]|nr:hypothetical protein [Calditrichota bacterium]